MITPTIIKAPDRPDLRQIMPDTKTIFLAGSIEMGKAENWQDKLPVDVNLQQAIWYNPRRDDWDSSWTQDISDFNFRQQVEWELDHLAASDVIVFYFDPVTQSPITLMELGHVAASFDSTHKKVIVCCPKGFWRRGNVQIMCARYNIPLVDNYDNLVQYLKTILWNN